MSQGLKSITDPNRLFPNSLRHLENSILEFYQALFSTFPINMLHYDDAEDKTEIRIEGRHTDNLSNIDTRPKIVVVRGAVSWSGRGLGGSNFIGSANLSPLKRQYTDINVGTVGISCFSREDLEADRISQICFDSIQMFSPVLRKAFGFLSIHSAQVGQRGLVKSDSRPELFVSPVLIQVQVTRNWQSTITDPIKLRDILVQLITNP